MDAHSEFSSEAADALLKRSAELDVHLCAFLNLGTYDVGRFQSSHAVGAVVLEHSASIKLLIPAGAFASVFSLMRVQYEALVRSMWLYYAASDATIAGMMAELTLESAKRADRVPTLAEMLDAMAGKAPEIALSMLREFKQYSWKPLSSWVHGGVHLLHRQSRGYPLALIVQALKASNGVSMMAAMHLIMISGAPPQSGTIARLQKEYADCLSGPRPESP